MHAMSTKPSRRDVIVVVAAAAIWTLVVVAFSTTMGSRPLRIYDWGPPVFACILTLLVMMKEGRAS
jgi:hypothetical protein